jgi:hypothetical protein
MTPKVHDLLLNMAEEEYLDLKEFLEAIAYSWKEKQEFVRSNNPTDEHAENICFTLFYKAADALKCLRTGVERRPDLLRSEVVKDGWKRLLQEYKPLAKAVSSSRS